MAALFSLENRMVFACARVEPDLGLLAELAERGPDWQAVVRKAAQWGLESLVYASLRRLAAPERVPATALEQLRHTYRRDTIHSVAQRELLGISLARFAQAGLPVVVLQGAALATLVYPAPNLRPIGDIDLLVHPPDHAQAEALLAGMQADQPSAPYLGPWGIHQLKLHEQLATARSSASPRAAARLPAADAWRRARPAQVEGAPTLALSHEDLMLQLALQLAEAQSADSPIRTLCDIAAVCGRFGGELDWDLLAGQAERYGAAKQLARALQLAHTLAGADLPPAILDSLASQPLARSGRAALRWLGAQLAAERVYGPRPVGVPLAAETAPPVAAPTPRAEPAQPGANPHRPGELAVTYDQGGASDGVGAQIQRIYGLYALARALGIKYVHTPLERVEYQGFIPMLTRTYDPRFVERYNTFFSLPSDGFDLAGCEFFKVHNLDLATVERFRAQAAATGRSILLITLLPFAYTDEYPAAYRALHAVSPYRDYRPAGPIRVCIHLRRGDNLPDSRRRWLPNSYYLRVCEQLLAALREHAVPYTLQLHSELPTRRYTLYPGSPGLFFEPEQPVTIDPADYALEDFEALPGLELVFNAEPLDAFRDFATADVLILSASSFGYLGGMLNPHGLVVFAPGTWNAPLPGWLVADAQGELNQAEMRSQIRNLLARPRAASDGIATLTVAHDAGLTSCLSVRLDEIAKYRINQGRYPDNVDSGSQFQRYVDHAGQNVAAMLLEPVRSLANGRYIQFHNQQQYAWYRELDLAALRQLAQHYCWPSQRVLDQANGFMRSMRGRTAVLYRGNDKIREIARAPYQQIFELAERSGAQQFWVQTDEADFFDAFRARFPDTERIAELPMIRRDDRACVLPQAGKAAFAVTFLAALYAIAQAPQIICTTGNTALWPMIFRGHTRGVWQYSGEYGTYVYGELPAG